MNKFRLEVVSPDGEEFSGEVESLLVHTDDGDVEILAGHADFLGSVTVGRVRIIENGVRRVASMSGGFLSVAKGVARLAAVTFEFAEDIDLARAESARERAETAIAAAKSDKAHRVAEAKLKRAINRISVSTSQRGR